MKHKSTIILLFVLVASIGISNCKKEPNFSTTPNISFKEIQQLKKKVPDPLGYTGMDSVVVTLHYQDGDADLGITYQEMSQIPWNGDKYNYEVKTTVKRNGKYVPYTDNLGYDVDQSGYFPPTGAKEGDLHKIFIYYPRQNVPKDTLKMQIRVIDKALHNSNWIETTPVIVN